MAQLKLARLPDRTPIKISIAILPELHQRLIVYSEIYAQTYGSEEPIADLIPAMLSAFLDSDREFIRAERRPG